MSNKSKRHRDHDGAKNDRWRPHKDWRIYVAVALMLAAMFTYVATMGE